MHFRSRTLLTTNVVLTVLERIDVKIVKTKFERLVLSAAKGSRPLLALLAALLLVWGCTKPPSEDKERLREVEKRFGDRYTLKLEGEFNLNARLKKGAIALGTDAQEIYKIFRFKDFAKREERDSSYVYLNMYDAQGKFLYQFFYDPQTKTFQKGNAPYP